MPDRAALLKSVMDLETIWYEFSPYLYAAFGFTALVYSPGSYLLKGSGILLITAVLTILRLRWIYRRALDKKVETAAGYLKQSRDQNQGQLWEEDQLGG